MTQPEKKSAPAQTFESQDVPFQPKPHLGHYSQHKKITYTRVYNELPNLLDVINRTRHIRREILKLENQQPAMIDIHVVRPCYNNPQLKQHIPQNPELYVAFKHFVNKLQKLTPHHPSDPNLLYRLFGARDQDFQKISDKRRRQASAFIIGHMKQAYAEQALESEQIELERKQAEEKKAEATKEQQDKEKKTEAEKDQQEKNAKKIKQQKEKIAGQQEKISQGTVKIFQKDESHPPRLDKEEGAEEVYQSFYPYQSGIRGVEKMTAAETANPELEFKRETLTELAQAGLEVDPEQVIVEKIPAGDFTADENTAPGPNVEYSFTFRGQAQDQAKRLMTIEVTEQAEQKQFVLKNAEKEIVVSANNPGEFIKQCGIFDKKATPAESQNKLEAAQTADVLMKPHTPAAAAETGLQEGKLSAASAGRAVEEISAKILPQPIEREVGHPLSLPGTSAFILPSARDSVSVRDGLPAGRHGLPDREAGMTADGGLLRSRRNQRRIVQKVTAEAAGGDGGEGSGEEGKLRQRNPQDNRVTPKKRRSRQRQETTTQRSRRRKKSLVGRILKITAGALGIPPAIALWSQDDKTDQAVSIFHALLGLFG